MSQQKDIKDKNENNKISFVKKRTAFYSFLIKKAEKLTSALYLVTDLLSDDEPLKNTLRRRSIDVLLNTSQCEVSHGDNKNVFFVSSAVSDILSCLEICDAVRLISQMNFEILKKEYTLFYGFLQDESLRLSSLSEVSFGDEFFSAELPESRPFTLEKSIQKNTYSVNSVKNSSFADNQNPQFSAPIARIVNDGKTERQEKIKAFFKGNNTMMSVKDIASHINGYSEKTLQRDLLELVDNGVLKKVGERRWSKYGLK